MRYHLYFIDNHDLGVDLIFFNIVQFNCAHFNYIEGQGHRHISRSMCFHPAHGLCECENETV